MRFWDASALVALVGREPRASELLALLDEDRWGTAWFFTAVEVRSALARQHRSGAIDSRTRDALWARFEALRPFLAEVDSIVPVRERAHRLLDRHPLRAADALQLAAAIEAAEGRGETLPFVTLDRNLADAAAKEGFVVHPPAAGESRLAESLGGLRTGTRVGRRGSLRRHRVRPRATTPAR